MVLLFTKAKENFNGQSKTTRNSSWPLNYAEHANLFKLLNFVETILPYHK
jgi:hypothetical protein